MDAIEAMTTIAPQPYPWILIRAFFAMCGCSAIMFCAGYLSWERSDLHGFRFYAPLFGGIFLSGLLFWVVVIRYALSIGP